MSQGRARFRMVLVTKNRAAQIAPLSGDSFDAFAHPGQRDFRHTSVFNHMGAKESQPIQATQL